MPKTKFAISYTDPDAVMAYFEHHLRPEDPKAIHILSIRYWPRFAGLLRSQGMPAYKITAAREAEIKSVVLEWPNGDQWMYRVGNPNHLHSYTFIDRLTENQVMDRVLEAFWEK